MMIDPHTSLGSIWEDLPQSPPGQEHPCGRPAPLWSSDPSLVVALGGPSHCPVSSPVLDLTPPSAHAAITLHPLTQPHISLLLCPLPPICLAATITPCAQSSVGDKIVPFGPYWGP